MRSLPVVLALATASGCATQTMYAWGGYDDALYSHYKNPADHEAFVARLKTIILAAEQQGLRVPPGAYAEYGFALYEEGQFDQAAAYFQKEGDTWPESRVLMAKMIQNAQQARSRVPAQPARGPAGAIEKENP